MKVEGGRRRGCREREREREGEEKKKNKSENWKEVESEIHYRSSPTRTSGGNAIMIE